MQGILLVLFCIFVSCFGLSCFYCDRNLCPGLDEDKCVHGVVKDVCGCCDVCARGEGEVCGGIFYDHACSAGTKCKVELEFGLPYHTYIQMNGTCKSEKQTDMPPVLEKPCKSLCSVDFCKTGRNSICSANRSSFIEVPDRAPCQHTTCKACRFYTDPDCLPCPEPVRKSCLYNYYLCVAEHYERNETILGYITTDRFYGHCRNWMILEFKIQQEKYCAMSQK